jgi:hypothetical protein
VLTALNKVVDHDPIWRYGGAVRKHDDGGWAADVLEHAADRCHGVSHRDFSCIPVSGVGGS